MVLRFICSVTGSNPTGPERSDRTATGKTLAPFRDKAVAQRGQSDVGGLFDGSHQEIVLRLDPPRAPITTALAMLTPKCRAAA